MRLWVCFALLLSLLVLTACNLPLPEGSYAPPDAAEMMAPPSVGQDAGRSDGAIVVPTIPGGGGGVGANDASGPGGPGGGVSQDGGALDGADGGIAGGGVGGGDAGPALSATALRLKKLEGRYLMRMDMLSTASATVAGLFTFATRNLVSHLVLTQLYVEGEQLKGTERLCYQTFKHVCTNGCKSLATTMSDAVVTELRELESPRSYTVNGNTLTGASQTMLLGFDATTNKTLPMAKANDPRVWDPIAGGVREGMLLTLEMQSMVRNVKCDVYNVQSFVSTFSGAMGGTTDAPSLLDREFPLVTTGGTGVTLGSNQQDCASDDGSSSSINMQTVRFALVTEQELSEQVFWSCPSQDEWNTRLKPPAP